jgi:hypothetical protein
LVASRIGDYSGIRSIRGHGEWHVRRHRLGYGRAGWSRHSCRDVDGSRYGNRAQAVQRIGNRILDCCRCSSRLQSFAGDGDWHVEHGRRSNRLARFSSERCRLLECYRLGCRS